MAENPKQITAWLPILQPLGPSLLTECETANALSSQLVENWLKAYMFAARPERDEWASSFANFLADSSIHLSHGRRVDIDQLRQFHVNATDLRENPPLREAVWNLYHAISWTLEGTTAFKIVESCHNTAYIRSIVVQQIANPLIVQPNQAPAPQQNPSPRKRKRH